MGFMIVIEIEGTHQNSIQAQWKQAWLIGVQVNREQDILDVFVVRLVPSNVLPSLLSNVIACLVEGNCVFCILKEGKALVIRRATINDSINDYARRQQDLIMNSMQTCNSITYYFMKNPFYDISRKCILSNMLKAVPVLIISRKTHFMPISENEFFMK